MHGASSSVDETSPCTELYCTAAYMGEVEAGLAPAALGLSFADFLQVL